MGKAIEIRRDISSTQLREIARQTRDSSEARRALAMAQILDGKRRSEVAANSGVSLQIIRDWVFRFNQYGLSGLRHRYHTGPSCRLSEAQLEEFRAIVIAGPDREQDGVVRWRCVDLQRVIDERFGVSYNENYVSTILKKLGFSLVSARPRHPKQNEEAQADFKKNSRTWCIPKARTLGKAQR